jgi:hypothetical protein
MENHPSFSISVTEWKGQNKMRERQGLALQISRTDNAITDLQATVTKHGSKIKETKKEAYTGKRNKIHIKSQWKYIN